MIQSDAVVSLLLLSGDISDAQKASMSASQLLLLNQSCLVPFHFSSLVQGLLIAASALCMVLTVWLMLVVIWFQDHPVIQKSSSLFLLIALG
jgi:hypothetical protein